MMRGLRPEIVLKPLPKTFSLPRPVPPTDYLKTEADTLSTVSIVKPHLPQTEPQQEEPQQKESPQQKEKQQAEKQQQAEKPQQAKPQQEEHKAID